MIALIQVVKEVIYKFGGVEKDNPRCVLEIAAVLAAIRNINWSIVILGR